MHARLVVLGASYFEYWPSKAFHWLCYVVTSNRYRDPRTLLSMYDGPSCRTDFQQHGERGAALSNVHCRQDISGATCREPDGYEFEPEEDANKCHAARMIASVSVEPGSARPQGPEHRSSVVALMRNVKTPPASILISCRSRGCPLSSKQRL